MAWLLAGLALPIGFLAGWFTARRGAQPAGPPQPVAAPTDPGYALVEEHRTGVVVADAAGRITYRNAAARRIGGTHAGVLVDAVVEKRLALGRDARGDHRDDEIVELYGPPKRVFDVTARHLADGGSVVFVDDITERRRLDQVRTDFVANVSHELKTPIGALSVLAETLVDETDPATVARVVDRMLAEAQRATSTIDALMELSRIELGEAAADDPVELGGVVRAAVDRAAELARQQHIDVTVAGPSPGDDAPVVAGDRTQLVSAVGNLVENAVKYSEPGGTVRVRVERVPPWCEITVSDDGIGIPQRDLNRVFERFYRVDRARSRGTGGTGLGLSIVRHVAGNHGGDVSVTSEEGRGSTFVLRLPLAVPAAPTNPTETSRDGAP